MGPASSLGVASIAMLVGFSSVVTAQDWGRILEEKAKQRANRHAEETIDKGLDAAEDAVRCVVTDQACIDSARQTGNDVVLTNKKGKALPPAAGCRLRSLVVNNRRVAVQKELSARPPTHDELGVTIPEGAHLELERTARQIAQYHPHWRIYEYSVESGVCRATHRQEHADNSGAMSYMMMASAGSPPWKLSLRAAASA